MINVNYHWDKLKTCVVGICYPPEFFSFIKDSKIRNVLEKITSETNEDLDKLSKLLEIMGVEVIRPVLKDSIDYYTVGNQILPPPLTPRDHFATIGYKFYMPTTDNEGKWKQLRGVDWPETPPASQEEFDNLPRFVKEELSNIWCVDQINDLYNFDFSTYKNVENFVKQQQNEIIYDQEIDSAMVFRLGQNLYFGTWPWQTEQKIVEHAKKLFPDYKCHVIDSQGHLDGCLSIISNELILSTEYIKQSVFDNMFPNHEIVYLKRSVNNDPNFVQFKMQNRGNWWIKGQEHNESLSTFIDHYLKSWTGHIEETVPDVNLLHIDSKNVAGFRITPQILKKLEEHGINFHLVEFRHFHFWDSGLHCVTNDISRIA